MKEGGRGSLEGIHREFRLGGRECCCRERIAGVKVFGAWEGGLRRGELEDEYIWNRSRKNILHGCDIRERKYL